MEFLKRLILLIGLCLLQALVLNHIHLFDCATPLLYVYFVVTFRRGTPKWAILVWSFVMGLAVDLFTNTPGLASSSMTLLGAVQPYLLELFVPRDSPEEMATSMNTLGVAKFIYLTVILVLIYCLVFFSIEAFSFTDWAQWTMYVGGSAALTMVLTITVETIRREK